MNPRLAGNLALVTVMAVTLVTLNFSYARSATPLDQVGLLVDLRHELVDEYVEAPDQDKLLEGAVRGMIDSLDDPYTVYMSPEEFKEFDKSVSGSFSGIGAEVRIHPEEDRLQIVTPLEDSPAWNAGVMAGDIVLEIDGQDTKGLKIHECVSRLTGVAGTDVTIKVRHETGEEATITITRARIQVDTVRGFQRDAQQHFDYWIDPAEKIAYVRLSQFSENTTRDLQAVLEQLSTHGLRGLILDLRFNPGGLLDAAEKISDMFLPAGQTIVSVKGRAVPERVFKSTSATTIADDVPVVVLANQFSASASEIVAGALSENDRAFFVGVRTFGKGSVQQLKLLEQSQGALKITNAYYYLPSGRNIHRRPINGEDEQVDKPWGVDPSPGGWVAMTAEQERAMLEARRTRDVVRQGNGAATDTAVTPDWLRDEMKDLQLAAAIEAVQGKLATGDWPQVGEDGAEELARAAQRDRLTRSREWLNEQIAQIDAQLADLGATEPPVTGEEAPPEVVTPAARDALVPDDAQPVNDDAPVVEEPAGPPAEPEPATP